MIDFLLLLLSIAASVISVSGAVPFIAVGSIAVVVVTVAFALAFEVVTLVCSMYHL